MEPSDRGDQSPAAVSRRTPFLQDRRWDLLAGIVLLAAVVFRLWHVDQARFAADEAYQFSVASRVAAFQMFPVTGTAITGVVEAAIPGGMYYLLNAIPLFFTNRAEGPMVFTSLLNLLGLAFGYWLFRREYGRPAALAALLLAVFNPFHVFHSDRQWNPNLMVPFSFAWMYVMTRIVRGQGRWPFFWLPVLLAILLQLHLSATLVVALTAVALLVARPRTIAWKHLVGGVAAAIGLYLPYLVWDALQGFTATQALLANLAGTTAPVLEAVRALYYMVLYPAGDFTYVVAKGHSFPMTEWQFLGGEGRAILSDFLGLPGIGGVCLAGAIVAGIVVSLGANLGLLVVTTRRFIGGLRAAIVADPLGTLAAINLPLVLAVFWGRKAFYPHFTIVVFPLALVPIAWLVSRLKSRRAVVAAVGLALVLAVAQGVLTSRWYAVDESRISVPVAREAARVIIEDANGAPVAFRCDVPRTRCNSYPLHLIARQETNRDFEERDRADRTYSLVAPGESNAVGAARVWDLGDAWLVRRDRRP
jgi:hypothetical protein